MTTTTVSDEEVLVIRTLGAVASSIRRPGETTEEAIARWSASTPKETRAAILATHRAAIEQGDAEERAKADAVIAEAQEKERQSIATECDAACSVLQGWLEKASGEYPGRSDLLALLDRRERGAA